MLISGLTKRAYCGICGKETEWEYTLLHVDESVFSPETPHNEEANEMNIWRCCQHQSLADTLEHKPLGVTEEAELSEEGYGDF
ncbi:MAG TPA: hypothetical protein VKQ72_22170 [Aggregatilineales bacterium]|nr:hypothetical protein [Aggregatilineales bacterium]